MTRRGRTCERKNPQPASASRGIVRNRSIAHTRVDGRKLQLRDFLRLRTLLALRYLELDQVTLLEGLVAITINSRIMNKHVRAAVLADESITFRVVKPLHSACCS